MNRQYLVGAGAGALALGLLVLAAGGGHSAADDKPEKIVVPKDIAESVNKMADTVGKGGDIKKDAEAFFKKHPDDFKKMMYVFAPRMEKGQGGFGVGAKPGAYEQDGIELLLIFKGRPMRNKITEAELKMSGADYLRVADVTIAIADLTHQYTPKKKKPMMDPADWTKYGDQMKNSALDLKKAIKDNKPEAAKTAFIMMYSSCTNCHSIFKEEK